MIYWLRKLVAVYFAVTITGLVAIYFSALPPSPDSSDFSNLVIAHRGYALKYPENSLPAIEAARRLGADAVEIDVMLTADGVPIAMHDADLERTTNGTGLVGDLTYAEISMFNLGNDAGGKPIPIPTLQQVIQLVKSLGLKLEIEMKTEIENKYIASRAVAALFDGNDLFKVAFVSSFDPRFLYHLRSENPQIVTALAIKSNPPYSKLVEFIIRRDGFADYLGTGIIEPSIEIADLDFIEKWVARGKAINVWTVDSQREKTFYRDLPVSITTDCPASYC